MLARFTQFQGQSKQATKYYRRTIELSRQNSDRYNEARAATNLGYVYVELGYWWRAEVLCHYALSIFEKLQNEHGRAHTENHLGYLYIRQHRWQNAQQHLERACNVWRFEGDEQGLVLGLINFGLLYNEMGHYKRAQAYLMDSLALANQLENKWFIGITNINLGISNWAQGCPNEAILYLHQAESTFRQFSSLSGMALAWDNLGLVYIDQEQWNNANQYLIKSLEAWHQLQNQHNAIRTQLYLVKYELAQNHRHQVTERLDSLEHLNHLHNWFDQYPVLYQTFLKYRHSLNKNSE